MLGLVILSLAVVSFIKLVIVLWRLFKLQRKVSKDIATLEDSWSIDPMVEETTLPESIELINSLRGSLRYYTIVTLLLLVGGVMVNLT